MATPGKHDDNDLSWMAMFDDVPARSRVPTRGDRESVPTTSRTRMTTTHRDKTRHDTSSGENDRDDDDDDNGSRSEDAGEADIDALVGITSHVPQKSQTSTLRDMLQDASSNLTFLPAGQGGTKGTKKTATNAARTVAQAATASDDDANGGGGDDDVPRPITLQRKYEDTVKRLYRPRPYDTVTEDGDDDDGDDDASHSSSETSAARTEHIRECFLCSWGDRFHDSVYGTLVNRLHAIFSLNYGRVENAALAQMLHLYFKKRVWQPGMPMLTQEVALTHIEQMHSLDPRITVGEMIRHYHRLFLTFQNEIYYDNGSFNPRAFAAMNHAGKMILSLYKSDPVKMNFYNPDLELDTKQVGRFTNIMANFSQKPVAASSSSSNDKRGEKRARDTRDNGDDARARDAKRARTEQQSHLFL